MAHRRTVTERAPGRLGRGLLVSVLVHAQLLVPLLILTGVYAERERAEQPEEVDVSFEAVAAGELPEGLPPVDRPREAAERRPAIKRTPAEDKLAEATPPVVVPLPVEQPPPPAPPAPPPPREHQKMVDLDMGKDVEPPPDARFLAQRNNRADVETRATETNLERNQAGQTGSSPSERKDDKIGDETDKIAELEDQESALGKQAPRVVPHAEAQLAESESEARSKSLLAMRDAPARNHEITPETADPSLPRDPDGAQPVAADRSLRGPSAAAARRRGSAKQAKLQLTGRDYEYIFGAEADAERRLAQRERSKHAGKQAERWGRIKSALENFIPEVRPGNQTALNTRAAPFAAYIARMHRSIHKLWGFGILEDWDGKPGSSPYNDPNLVTTLELVLNGDGTVDKVTVASPSGYLPFDVAAIDVAYSAGPYPDPPREIRSGNGKIYVHWQFHRDERQCATSGVDYYILANAPAGGDRGEVGAPLQAGLPTPPRENLPRSATAGGRKRLARDFNDPAHRAKMRELDEAAGGTEASPEPDPEAAREAAAQVARADDPLARSVAARWFAAYAHGDVAAMVGVAAFPFRSSSGVAAAGPSELGAQLKALLDETSGKRTVRTLELYSAAGVRGALGTALPSGLGETGGALFAVAHAGGDNFVLILAKRSGLWKAIGLVRR